jgi:hypothetical protein
MTQRMPHQTSRTNSIVLLAFSCSTLSLFLLLNRTLREGGDANLIKAALSSLRNDTGLHQLVPYFAKFISEEVAHNLRNLALLKVCSASTGCVQAQTTMS